MKLRYTRDDVLHAVQLVQNITSTKAVLPILSNVLLEAKDGNVFINATDLEMSVRCTVKAQIEEEGAVTINGRRFGDIVREAPDGDISLTVGDKSNIAIKCGRSTFRLTGLPVGEFPAFPELEGLHTFTLESEKLRDLIRKAAFACSVNEVRVSLGGVYIEVAEGNIVFVATDGRRLAKVKTKVEGELGKGFNALVPAKVLNEVNRVIEGSKEVQFIIMKNQIGFKVDGVTLVSRLIEGHFPDYKKVIPEQHNARVKVNRERMLASLRRVAILTSEKSRSVKLSFNKGSLAFDSVVPDVGEAHEDTDVEYGGDEFVVSFNPDYLIDFLKNVMVEDIHFDLIDPSSACLLRPVGEEDYLYVVMPMKG